MRGRGVIAGSLIVVAVGGSAALWAYTRGVESGRLGVAQASASSASGAPGQATGVEADSGPYSELLQSRSQLFRALDRGGYPEQCRAKMLALDSLVAKAQKVERWGVRGTIPAQPQKRLAIWLVRAGSDANAAIIFGWDVGGSTCAMEMKSNLTDFTALFR